MKAICRLLLVSLLFAGCFRPGGGGTTHIPPEQIVNGEPTELRMDFSVWGAGSGNLANRYTKVVCIYRVNDSGEEHRIDGVVVTADEKRMAMKFTIPPLELKNGDNVTYNFEMLFDGHANKRKGGTLFQKRFNLEASNP